MLGLVGESGCGKTTIGMALLGHCRSGGRVASGAVLVDGRDIAELAEAICGGCAGTVSSSRRTQGRRPGAVDRHPDHRDPGAHAAGAARRRRAERARQSLDEVALPSDDTFLHRYPHQLSGEQQRVAITDGIRQPPEGDRLR